MNNCESCKFWNVQRYSYVGTDRGGGEENPEWEYCELAKTDYGKQEGFYGPDGNEGGKPIRKVSLALALGDRDGMLKTHRTFGCVQWEPR